ncbi:MAG: hypothetical protein H6R27_127 [Proteobacteria bacterium]|nr:hypothetical protein [Pseudomonadota bacterium]
MTNKVLFRRFLTVLAVAFAVITLVQWLKGHTLTYALLHGGLWGTISAVVFAATSYYKSRHGQRCEVCDEPSADKQRE